MRLLAAILATALLMGSAVHAQQRNLSQTDLDRDGRLSAAPEVVSTGSTPNYEAAAEAASVGTRYRRTNTASRSIDYSAGRQSWSRDMSVSNAWFVTE
jgi:hypothetical protein